MTSLQEKFEARAECLRELERDCLEFLIDGRAGGKASQTEINAWVLGALADICGWIGEYEIAVQERSPESVTTVMIEAGAEVLAARWMDLAIEGSTLFREVVGEILEAVLRPRQPDNSPTTLTELRSKLPTILKPMAW